MQQCVVRMASLFVTCGGAGVYDDDDEPPPPYEEECYDPDDALPLGVLLLCAQQKQFHLPSSRNARILVVGSVSPERDRFVQSLHDQHRHPERMFLRTATVREASNWGLLRERWFPTHLAIFDAADHDLSSLYETWNYLLQFPSKECFIAMVHRTYNTTRDGCLIVDLEPANTLDKRIFYHTNAWLSWPREYPVPIGVATCLG